MSFSVPPFDLNKIIFIFISLKSIYNIPNAKQCYSRYKCQTKELKNSPKKK